MLVLCLQYRLLQTAVSDSLTRAVRGGCRGPGAAAGHGQHPPLPRAKTAPVAPAAPSNPCPGPLCSAGPVPQRDLLAQMQVGTVVTAPGAQGTAGSWTRPGGQPSSSLGDVRSHTRCFVRHYLRQTRPLTLFSDSSHLPSPAEVQITSFMGTNVALGKRLLMDTERLISLFVLGSQFYGPMLYQRSSLQSLKPMRIRSVTLE